MLQKKYITTLVILSIIASTSFADNKDQIQALVKQISEAQEVLKSGITNPNISLKELKETTITIAQRFVEIDHYLKAGHTAKQKFLGTGEKIKLEKIWRMEHIVDTANKKTEFNEVINIVDQLLKDLE